MYINYLDTTTMQDPTNEKDTEFSAIQENNSVPQQLKEVNELLIAINRRLEDCAVEWQAGISHKQWETFDSKSIPEQSWGQSVLARTYFTEKLLDDAFENLLYYNRTFSMHLKNFIALLQNTQLNINLNNENAGDIKIESSDLLINNMVSNHPSVKPLDLSSLTDQCFTNTNSKNLIGPNMSIIQESFANVINAKINFDTKFLGFEAILHSTTTSYNDITCFCQICSNVVGTVIKDRRKVQNIKSIDRKESRIKRTKRNALTRSTRTLTKKSPNIQSVPFGYINDESPVDTRKN